LGSGETTVGGESTKRLGIAFIELDAMSWLPTWLPGGRAGAVRACRADHPDVRVWQAMAE